MSEKIYSVLVTLATAYPKEEPEKDTVKLYARMLADIDPELLEAAALDHIANNKWFPTIAELRAAAGKLQVRALGVPSSYEAWQEVTKAFSSHGRWRVPEWSHPAIEKAVGYVGGWMALCNSENGVADRARFIQCYDRILERQAEDAQMLPAVRQHVKRLADGMKANGAVKELTDK